MTIRLAIYGKGGIGKSTVTSNLSYCLSLKGLKVLQIGCDPKHDSTRAIIHGTQDTVMDYIRSVPAGERSLEDVMICGENGVMCIEAGGPEPGVGCAGRGIITMFNCLRNLGLKTSDFDVVIYDVLGDVVCGGFAVPMREEHCDACIIVTSGEFMSVYAANNILRGISNYEHDGPKVAGFVFNRRNSDGESDVVGLLSRHTSIPILADIPRHRLFAEAESEIMTACQKSPESEISAIFGRLADTVASIGSEMTALHHASYLNDDGLTSLARREEVSSKNVVHEASGQHACNRVCSRASEGKVLQSCAAAGGVHGCSSITDSVTIVHGPRSCAHIMSSSKDLADNKRKNTGTGFIPQATRIVSSDVDNTIAVFGGTDLLESRMTEFADYGIENIFVVTTCVPGIIGDDCKAVISRFKKKHPGITAGLVCAEGNMTGEFEEGLIDAARMLIGFVDKSVKPERRKANLIAERYFFKNDDISDDSACNLLKAFGFEVNCRFLYRSDMNSIRNLKKGSTNFVVDRDSTSERICDILENDLGMDVCREPLPVGIGEYRRFARKVAEIDSMKDLAESNMVTVEREYSEFLQKIRKRSENRKVLIIDKFTQSIDWLIELVTDMGMSIVKVGIGPKNPPEPTTFTGEIGHDYSIEDLVSDIESLEPDLVLTDSGLMIINSVKQLTYVRPCPGMDGAIEFANRICDALIAPSSEGWRCIS